MTSQEPSGLQTASSAGPAPGIAVTLDFGTSRAVAGVYNYRTVRTRHQSLPRAGLARAVALLGVRPESGYDWGLSFELATMEDPLLRADVWETIFDTPPLASNFLEATKVRSSDLALREDGVFRIDFADEVAGSPTRFRGVKRYLSDLDREVEGTGLTAGEIFGQVYARFAELVRRELGVEEQLKRVHITFPTKLPPDRRDALLKRVSGVAPVVEMKIDEAAAMSGFFLMKRLGPDPVLGVEGFKARARCPEGYRAWEDPAVWDNAGQWHENLLIIDVGGGTTDCALVKVVVADITPAAAGADCPGRYYEFQPQVVASGGRLHLGGDLLTLKIFELLKERLGVPGPETRFADVAEDVAAIRRAAFDALWSAAEEAKHEGLRGEKPVAVRVRCADAAAVPPHAQDSLVTVPASRVTVSSRQETVITAADFEEVIASTVERVAALAAGIASGGLDVLNASAEGESGASSRQGVDHVLLSGGSLLAGTLRARVEESLRARFAADGLDPTFTLDFDSAFCKTGTAVGGMYLNSAAFTAEYPDHPLVISDLQEGRSKFRVDASRLHVNLAADFYLHGWREVRPAPLFKRGLPLSGPGDAMYAEAKGYSVMGLTAVHRYDVPIEPSLVNVSEDEDEAEKEGEKTVWASLDMNTDLARALSERGVQANFEIDQDERITLTLCKGEPRPVLFGDPVELDPGHVPDDGLVRDNALLHDLYLDIVRPIKGLDLPLTPLLKAGTAVPVLTPVVPGAELYVAVGEATESPEFGVVRPGYNLVLQVPQAHQWLSVDESGGLRTHRNRPDSKSVDSMEELLDAPEGTVYRVAMESPPLYDKNRDPFSGEH